MRRKNIIAVAMAAAMIGLTACGSASGTASAASSGSASSAATTAAATTTTAAAKNVDFDGSSYSDMGDGTFILRGPGGTTEDGSVITVYAESNAAVKQIDFATKDINGNSLSYIYIDGMLTDKEQVSQSQMILNLSGKALKVGTHKVELVQFEDDDTNGTVTTYKTASYEIKAK